MATRDKKCDTHFHLANKIKDSRNEKDSQKSSTRAAKAELVHHLEDLGILVTEDTETTYDLTQKEIIDKAPLAVAQQVRTHLTTQEVDGGMKGHLATFDWRTKELGCEIQVQEKTTDVQYLHDENFLQLLKNSLCTSMTEQSEHGVLGYLDVSIGQFVARHYTGLGPLKAICSSPHNGVVHVGHSNGTVTMWTPNIRKPVVKMLCHRGGITDIAIAREGKYMVSTGYDAKMRVWDIRQYKPINCFPTIQPACSIDVSQRGLVAYGQGSYCEIWQDIFTKSDCLSPYLKCHLPGKLHKLQFCPFEDCLGIGHNHGFSSIVVPGAGEANIDGLEVNPYQNKHQKQEWEVKALLEKIPSDLIVLEPQQITQIHTGQKQRQIEEKSHIASENEKDGKHQLKRKLRGRSKPGKLASRKQALINAKERLLKRAKVIKLKTQKYPNKKIINAKAIDSSILNRFT